MMSMTDKHAMLFSASRDGSLETIISLVHDGVDINAKNSRGDTPIHLAAKHGQKDIVEYLINAGADTNISRSFDNFTILHYASRYEGLDMVESLLKKGADVNAKNSCGDTPIHLAAIHEQTDIVEYLINAGADTNISRSYDNFTILHYASRNGWLDMVESLLKKGADVNAKNSRGDTPIHLAAIHEQKDIVECLINAGADTNISRSYDNSTILHYASRYGWLDMVESLLKKNVNIEAKCANGRTPLQIALVYKRIEIVKHLINAGADVNVKCKNDFNLQPELVRLFIQNGKYLESYDYERLSCCPVLKTCVLQDIELCSQAIINEFNYKALPQLYTLSMACKILPRIEKMRILNVSNNIQMSQVTQDVMQSVKHEIDSKGFCNVLKASPIVLKMLTVKSFLTYCENIQRQNQLKRAAEFDSDNRQVKLSKIL